VIYFLMERGLLALLLVPHRLFPFPFPFAVAAGAQPWKAVPKN
jgi:hypothetical protein